jgi:hypothetical protein
MHRSLPVRISGVATIALLVAVGRLAAQGFVVDHTSTSLHQIPATAITQAKAQLRIAYGHTSHGSQLVDG